MSDYSKLAAELKEYSRERKGPVAKLTYDAAVAIGVLEARIWVLENERMKTEDDGR